MGKGGGGEGGEGRSLSREFFFLTHNSSLCLQMSLIKRSFSAVHRGGAEVFELGEPPHFHLQIVKGRMRCHENYLGGGGATIVIDLYLSPRSPILVDPFCVVSVLLFTRSSC